MMYKTKFNQSDLSKITLLITGGAGFIGSNLVEYFVQHNIGELRVLDNLSTGRIQNIEKFLELPNVTFINGDIRNLEICNSACKGVDYILHQAALGSVPRSINDPTTSNEVNVSGFLNILVAAKDSGVKRVVYAASSSTYGDSKEMPKVEENIGKPLSPYAVTKYVNELYADVFYKTYGLETIGLRYFNVFGPKQNPEGAYAAVIPKFVLSFLKNEAPIINGDGEFSRDFTFIHNVVQANVLAMFSEEGSVNQVFNVAFGERTTLNKLIHLIKDSLSRQGHDVKAIEPYHKDNRIGDVPHSLASIEKAKKMLNYSPDFNIENGLEETILWYLNSQ